MRSLLTYIEKLWIRQFCAVTAIDDQLYALTMLTQYRKNAEVDTICYGSLSELAKTFSRYGLCIAVPHQHLITHSWFFPVAYSESEIYKQVLRHRFSLKDQQIVAFDIAISAHNESENMVIAYFLPIDTYVNLSKKYGEHGWRLAAIEPDEVVINRSINKAWQLMAQQKFQTDNFAPDIKKAVEITLKLLDRDNGLW